MNKYIISWTRYVLPSAQYDSITEALILACCSIDYIIQHVKRFKFRIYMMWQSINNMLKSIIFFNKIMWQNRLEFSEFGRCLLWALWLQFGKKFSGIFWPRRMGTDGKKWIYLASWRGEYGTIAICWYMNMPSLILNILIWLLFGGLKSTRMWCNQREEVWRRNTGGGDRQVQNF